MGKLQLKKQQQKQNKKQRLSHN